MAQNKWRKNSSQVLIGQFSNYKNKKASYDHQFIDEIYTVQSWWTMTYEKNDDNNYIRDLALKILSVRPHGSFAIEREETPKKIKIELISNLGIFQPKNHI